MTKTQSTAIPYNGSGTINIHINNPSANMHSGMPAYTPVMPYPMVYPYYSYPPNYYLGNLHNGGINQITNINTNPNQGNANNGNGLGADALRKNALADNSQRFVRDAEKVIEKAPDKKKERNIVILTDNYVKTLENHLRSNNKKLRQEAIAEVLMRFKEDKSRIDNPSLTALLNIALQDQNATVRSTAMTIIQAGYAKGDKLTEQLLQQIQGTKKSYSQDATQAADSLLQMSKTKVKVNDNSHYLDQVESQKKGK